MLYRLPAQVGAHGCYNCIQAWVRLVPNSPLAPALSHRDEYTPANPLLPPIADRDLSQRADSIKRNNHAAIEREAQPVVPKRHLGEGEGELLLNAGVSGRTNRS